MSRRTAGLDHRPHPADPFDGPYSAGSPLNRAWVRLAAALGAVALVCAALLALGWGAAP